jgi:hypothetical protein
MKLQIHLYDYTIFFHDLFGKDKATGAYLLSDVFLEL